MMLRENEETVFVQRDEEGKIVGVYRRAQPGYADEEILASDAEVVAFVSA